MTGIDRKLVNTNEASNVYVINEAGRDIIVAANREKAEAALYVVTK